MAYKQSGWSAFTRRSNKRLERAEQERDMLQDRFANIPADNPYEDMENVYEDMTVDQRGYDLEMEQIQQSQSNILNNLKQVAGPSGAGGLVQTLIEEKKIAKEEASSKLETQESENEKLKAEEEAKLQLKEREGEVWSRNTERDKQATLLDMAKGDVDFHRESKRRAQERKLDALSNLSS